MAQAQLGFCSWVRRGLAAGVTSEGANLQLTVTMTPDPGSKLDPDEAQVSVKVGLVGPGDIIGFDPRCILKKRPDANTLDAETEPYPMVEFDQADLPWRYTPEAAADGTLKVWIALIVIEESELEAKSEAADGKLATISVGKDKLPDLSGVSYWAHTQVGGTATLNEDLMANAPQKLVSRLICPRLLDVNKTYHAYLVPTFAGGVAAGLGDEQPPDPRGFAWDSNSGTPVKLPVYYQWSFKTGNVGSFRQLALRLRPGVLASTIGWRQIDVSSPGLVPLPAAKGDDGQPIPMQVEGALQSPPAKQRTGVPQPDGDWVAALKNFVDKQEMRIGDDPNASPRKVVAPPLYGRWPVKQQEILTQTGWFRTLNVDPTLRVAAALGTAVVQKEQEALMASAWRQAGDLPSINQALKVLQLASEAYARSYDRHFLPLGTSPAPTEAFLQRVRSLHGKMPFTASHTLAGAVQSSCLGIGVMSGAWRRVARGRGKTGRLARAATWSAIPWVKLAPWIGRPPNTLSGGTTFDDVMQTVMAGNTDAARAEVYQEKGSEWLERWGLELIWVGRKLLQTKEGKYWWLIVRLMRLGTILLRMAGIPGWTGWGSWPPIPEAPEDLPDPFSPPKPFPPTSEPVPVPPTVYLDPRRTLPDQFWCKVKGVTHADRSLDLIMAAPEFPQPMYEPLRDISKDWILPGISDVSGNTVAIALTNQTFIEGYMVGLNHEMARELVWRDYPTDRRGTCFRQFWDTRGRVPVTPPTAITEKRDISPIHGWGLNEGLGSHRPPGAGSPNNQVVLMVYAAT
jgi:hypothetical protein